MYLVMSNQIVKIEELLIKSKDNSGIPSINLKVPKPLKPTKGRIPRGNPKSGRPWKSVKERFKSIVKTRGIRVSNAFDKQMKLREELQRVKTISKAREQERREVKELKKQRRRENLERRKQNELKSEIVQVIKNPAKIKRMNRKQLRSIAKRDVTQISPNKIHV